MPSGIAGEILRISDIQSERRRQLPRDNYREAATTSTGRARQLPFRTGQNSRRKFGAVADALRTSNGTRIPSVNLSMKVSLNEDAE
jgi:hypothetical protein